MSQFAVTKRKLSKIQDAQNKAQADLKRENLIRVDIRSENFIKTSNSLVLLEHYQVLDIPVIVDNVYTPDTNVYATAFLFENFPEELVNISTVVPIFSSTTAWVNLNLLNSTYAIRFNYQWEKIATNNYKLHIVVFKKYNTTNPKAAIYLDLSLHFLNSRNFITQ